MSTPSGASRLRAAMICRGSKGSSALPAMWKATVPRSSRTIAREIPPLGVPAVLVDEPGGAVHERCAAAAADRLAEVGELGGAHVV